MPFETYAQVHARRAMIAAMVGAGRMPPWFAKKGGDWTNDISLNDRDKSDLLAWIAPGAPEGDSRDAPLPRRQAAGWNIGKPDAIVPLPEPISIPAEGVVAYKNVYVQTHFGEEKWVTAVEIKPSQARVVHHAIVVLEEPGRTALTPEQVRRLKPGDAFPPQPIDTAAEFFAITVPGSLGIRFPEGSGKKLPKDAWFRFQIHYQPNGKAVMDRTEIGLKFATTRVREVKSLSALNNTFVIPPNKAAHKVVATHEIKESGELLALLPHMHLRGAAFRYDLRYPNGKTKTLLEVPRYDFNWQTHYEFRTPLSVPAGSRIVATAWFDNSKGNPWNPDPTKAVRWGEQSYEEMMIGYFDFLPAPKKVGK